MDFTRTKHDALGNDLEHHIHCLETDAYRSVLKAFISQSDLLSWGKEGLMTDLRKELNVTDLEHGEILEAVNSDESVKRIRDQRKLTSHAESYNKVNKAGSASGSKRNSSIIMKTSSPAAYFPQKNVSHCQSSAVVIPITSSMPPKFKDDRKALESTMFSHGNAEQSTELFQHKVPLLPLGRGGVVKVKHQLKKCLHTSDVIEMRATDRVILDEFQVWALVKESKVEKMLFNGENPDPVVIEKAKSTLREQERSILEALAKLTDVLKRHDPSTQLRHYRVLKDTSALGTRKG